MLLLLLIAVDFGRVFFTFIEVNNAAREAAAFAAGNPTDDAGITAHAAQETSSQSQAGEGAITVSVACDSAGSAIDCASSPGGGGAGNTITVTVAEKFSFLTPLINGFFGSGLDVSASASSAVLNLAAGGGGTPGSCQTLPTAVFTVAVSDLTVTLDASNSTPYTGLCAISGYNWDMGDGVNPFPPITGKQVTYPYAHPGIYVITLEVTNQVPPGATTSQTVNVGVPAPSPTASPSPSPSLSPTPVPTPACLKPDFTWQSSGKTVTFQGSYTGYPAPDTWSWNFGDNTTGTGQNPSHTYGSNSSHTVKLTITAGTCTSFVTHEVKP